MHTCMHTRSHIHTHMHRYPAHTHTHSHTRAHQTHAHPHTHTHTHALTLAHTFPSDFLLELLQTHDLNSRMNSGAGPCSKCLTDHYTARRETVRQGPRIFSFLPTSLCASTPRGKPLTLVSGLLVPACPYKHTICELGCPSASKRLAAQPGGMSSWICTVSRLSGCSCRTLPGSPGSQLVLQAGLPSVGVQGPQSGPQITAPQRAKDASDNWLEASLSSSIEGDTHIV